MSPAIHHSSNYSWSVMWVDTYIYTENYCTDSENSSVDILYLTIK